MSNIKNAQRFSELEYGLQEYFAGKVTSVMNAVKNDLSEKRSDELKAYQNSSAGFMSMANYDKSGDTIMATLKHTGKWNTKSVEDYVAMCQQKLHTDKGFQKDLLTFASEWRGAVVKQIGRERYDQLSQQLGGDLAYAYVSTRMDNLMMQKLVKDGMPKSTSEYIIRKAAQGSIWGLEQELTKSPLAREIEAKGEAAFKPSKGAKVAGKVSSSVVDAATLGIGSWTSFATYVGGDMLVNAVFSSKPTVSQKEQVMETAISKGVFGSNRNVFDGFRQQAEQMYCKTESTYLNSLNSKLNNKITTPKKVNSIMSTEELFESANNQWQPAVSFGKDKSEDKSSERSDHIPLLIAPGKVEDYLAYQAKIAAEDKRKAEEETAVDYGQSEASSYGTASTNDGDGTQQNVEETEGEGEGQSNTTATSGWDSLVQAIGMDGFGDVMNNAGYVISKLPDVILGMFTGKTQSLTMSNTLMPIAAILAGMFVKNPMLKMALIGLGGANLLNKAGKESLGLSQGNQLTQNSNQQVKYRQYDDESLNPRITNPVLQGTTLIANIDNVPCSIQLTQNVVNAHEAGALPLNTLANAVLARYDAQNAAERQYSQISQQTLQQNQTETIHRSR